MHYEKTITAEIQLDCALLSGKQAVTTSNVHNSGITKKEVAGNLSDSSLPVTYNIFKLPLAIPFPPTLPSTPTPF